MRLGQQTILEYRQGSLALYYQVQVRVCSHKLQCANNSKTPLTQVAKLEDPNLKQGLRNLRYPPDYDNAAGAKVVEMQTPGLTWANYPIFLPPLL